ncbi:MAG: hypothetical protein IKP54_05255 [Bacteroidales bacterium]|nr:hypothetical protein [Bacteroidales bacterium]
MKKLLSFLAVVLISTAVFAQSVTLTFTAKDAANHYVQLNRVAITNLTKGWQETIYWPDTTLTMQNGTGIANVETCHGASLHLSQNNPNPFTGTTEVSLMVATEGTITMDIADINGRIVETWCTASLQPGTHQFRITLATAGTYVMTARQNGQTSFIKMVCNGGIDANKMEFLGAVLANDYSQNPVKSNPRGATNNPFTFGDQMEYVGYATINGTEAESQYITQAQNASQTLILQFAETGGNSQDGQPCPGAATVTDYDNNTYNTVQIGNQCWMKENLRSTHFADGTAIPAGTTTNTIVAYRYAPNNDESNVMTYGYLYNWPAVMHGVASSSANPSGVQGICPAGWHMPSKAEWAQLTTYVHDNGYQCPDCNASNYWSHVDCIAKVLAAQTGWPNYSHDACAVGYDLSTNNATGFSALPAGFYCGAHYFGQTAYFWSTTQYNSSAYTLSFDYCTNYVNFNDNYKSDGYSVRCVRGAVITLPTVTTDFVGAVTDATATCGGTVTADGNAAVTMRGVCWDTLPDPTVSNSYTVDGTGLGVFNSSMTGLASGTIYYVRAYATNSAGTAYGAFRTFTTKISVNTSPVSGITATTVVCGGTVNSAGNAEVTMRGVCWDTLPAPTLNGSHTVDGTGAGVFTSNITGLTPGTTYYIRAYATNNAGTVFGDDIIFSTVDTTPTVTTKTISFLTDTSAFSGGNITFDGGAAVTMRGICWDTLPNPTVSGIHTTDGTGIGIFMSSMMSLTPGTTYYVRAYATNSVGTTYGQEISFRTFISCPGMATVTDHEGNVYNTVQIGNQCWMRENMRCTTSPSTGTMILEYPANYYSYTGKKAYYVNGDPANTATYGLLYNWAAAVDTFNTTYGETSTYTIDGLSVVFSGHRRGICPAGWHVPSNAEWTQLTTYVYNNGYQCSGCSGVNNVAKTDCIAKALASQTGWSSSGSTFAVGNDPSSNNATGFSAVPAGVYTGSYTFGANNHYWSATQSGNDAYSLAHYLSYHLEYVGHIPEFKFYGYSVRCVRD